MITWKEVIKQKLEKFPEIKFEEGEGFLKVFPKDTKGFFVSIDKMVKENELTVSYAGVEVWNNHCADDPEAIRWFFFGLSNKCRLKFCYCGDVLYREIIESHFENDWCSENISGSIFYPFWRKRRIEYLSNDLIPFEGKFRLE